MGKVKIFTWEFTSTLLLGDRCSISLIICLIIFLFRNLVILSDVQKKPLVVRWFFYFYVIICQNQWKGLNNICSFKVYKNYFRKLMDEFTWHAITYYVILLIDTSSSVNSTTTINYNGSGTLRANAAYIAVTWPQISTTSETKKAICLQALMERTEFLVFQLLI